MSTNQKSQEDDDLSAHVPVREQEEPLIVPREAAAHLRISLATLLRLSRTERFPVFASENSGATGSLSWTSGPNLK